MTLMVTENILELYDWQHHVPRYGEAWTWPEISMSSTGNLKSIIKLEIAIKALDNSIIASIIHLLHRIYLELEDQDWQIV